MVYVKKPAFHSGNRLPTVTRKRVGRSGVVLVLCVAIAIMTGGCQRDRSYPSQPILLVCPWAQGGGTDRVSRIVAAHLEQELGVPVNVINAVGGKGVTGHSRGLTARPDGYTIAMTTLELNMMHWCGLTDLTVADCIPLMSLNEDYAALFVRTDSPWTSLAELEAHIEGSPETLRASGTTTGGAWHLALAGWLIEARIPVGSVTWVSSTGSAPSLQELISGGLDMVCCSLPEASSLLDAGQVRALGVMAPRRVVGYEQVLTFAEQGTDWSLGGWRALAVPLNTPQPVREILMAAIQRMVTGETQIAGLTFPQFMDQSGFDRTYRSGVALTTFLNETDDKFGKLMTSDSMRSVNRDAFHPMTFPGIILGLIGIVTIAGMIQSWRGSTPADSEAQQVSSPNYIAFGLVVLAMLAYALLAEVVGFILIAFAILLVLSVWMGVRLRWAFPYSVIFPLAIYQLFAHGLRVPLPQGWLGW